MTRTIAAIQSADSLAFNAEIAMVTGIIRLTLGGTWFQSAGICQASGNGHFEKIKTLTKRFGVDSSNFKTFSIEIEDESKL